MEDRTFYVMSYAAFCLAMIFPVVWFVMKANRKG
jgi:hypothetical protein